MFYGLSNKIYPLFIKSKKLVETDHERDLGIIFLDNFEMEKPNNHSNK
jgi:hypothetical protein